MIAELKGILSFKSLEYVIIEVSGIGYQIYVPLSTYYELPSLGSPLALRISPIFKEDNYQLYGFWTLIEKEIFQLLLKVTGVGPKLSLNILSGMGIEDLGDALAKGDIKRLKMIPGLGEKVAQRISLELKDKIRKVLPARNFSFAEEREENLDEDVISLLQKLGYKRGLAEKIVKQVKQRFNGISIEDLVRESLKELASTI
ncbi:MAG: Holliday junction branch migration protein RuvA [bacterium]|nr:Holliday junction branch migration protein RuvA [bacterium]